MANDKDGALESLELWKKGISNVEFRMMNTEVFNKNFGIRYSLFNIHYSFFSGLILVLIFFSTGCVKAPHLRPQIDERVQEQIDREITCAEAPDGTCAIASEFHELADRAVSESTPEAPKHFVSLLNDGQDALLARIHLIRAAKKSIELQTYIWVDDEVGRLMFFELLEAARRGIKVRIIADQMGSATKPDILAQLATLHINLEIAFYNPVFSRGKTTPLTLTTGALFSFRRIDQRMHNKVFVIDKKIGIVGGRNIENKYYDYDPKYNFKDRDVIIMGPAVADMSRMFDRYWNHEVVVKAIYLVDVGKEIIKSSESGKPSLLEKPDISMFSDIDSIANQYSLFEERSASRPLMAGRVKYTSDLPGKKSKNGGEDYEDITNTMRDVASKAQKSLTVQTPYFILSKTAKKMIKKIRKKNPDLKLTVSSNSLAATDLFIIYAITYKQKKNIIKNLKINLYEFKPYPEDARKFISRYDQLMTSNISERNNDSSEQSDLLPTKQSGPRSGLHAKSIVVDSKVAIIGSHNLDPRSQNINTESAVIIWDQETARRLEQNILLDTEPQNSWVVAKRQKVPIMSYFSGIIGSISAMIPFFDIWPFRYTSSFELKEGQEPLLQDHPDFYKHYRDVGQFPEVHLTPKAIQTRLFKALGGFTTPLL